MKKRYKVMASMNSFPVMFPTQFAENVMEDLESSPKTVEDEIEQEKEYLNHLFHYDKPISSIIRK